MSEFVPVFEKWRHGGWYVTNIHYPSGAVGCVGKTDDGKWAIACGPSWLVDLRFSTRTDAANAEYLFAQHLIWSNNDNAPGSSGGRHAELILWLRDRLRAERFTASHGTPQARRVHTILADQIEAAIADLSKVGSR